MDGLRALFQWAGPSGGEGCLPDRRGHRGCRVTRIAGTVLGAAVALLRGVVDDSLARLLARSLILEVDFFGRAYCAVRWRSS